MWCALYGLHNINVARLGRSPVPFVISGQWLTMPWSHLGSVWKLHTCRAAKYDIFGMPSTIASHKLLEGVRNKLDCFDWHKHSSQLEPGKNVPHGSCCCFCCCATIIASMHFISYFRVHKHSAGRLCTTA